MKAKFLPKSINIRVPLQLYEAIAEAAQSRNIGMSPYARDILTEVFIGREPVAKRIKKKGKKK